jgi:thiosulfate/3-mercaptopyruvate sulfurtransferase
MVGSRYGALGNRINSRQERQMIPPVVDLAWWQQHEADVVVADVRWYLDGRSGRDAYDRGHLPGAVFVDLDRWLSGAGSPEEGRNPLPVPAVFATGMAQLGIADDDIVVAYDDAGGVIAARLVWMLRVTGHRAALLDGGLSAHDGPLELVTAPRPAAVFTPRPWPRERLADIDDAADATNLVLDARDRGRYRGEHDPVDPRPGHIPGARNLPCRENLAPDGRFLPAEQLRQRLLDAGVTDGARIISYCGSGVTACHNLLTIELAGLGHGRLYPGSWSQYSRAAERTVATGSAPG